MPAKKTKKSYRDYCLEMEELVDAARQAGIIAKAPTSRPSGFVTKGQVTDRRYCRHLAPEHTKTGKSARSRM